MSARLLCPSASGPLEAFAVQLDNLLQTLAQWRQGFRIHLSGLPLPHDRSRGADSATDHLARQYLESVGEIDNGSVATTTLWAGKKGYYSLHVMPSTPSKRLAGVRQDPAFAPNPKSRCRSSSKP